MSTNTGKRKEAQILGLYPRSDRTHENHPDPRRGVGNISTTPQRLEDAENPGSETSTTSVAVKAGYYTREDIDIMNAVLHTPPSGTSPAPTAGHDRRFITLVGPPPAPSKDTSETSTTTQSTRPPPQQLSQPRLQPTASQQPQPSTSSPTLPPSQKQPPPATWQPSATRDGEEAQISTTQSVVTSISSLTPSPSQRPEKQPDSVATPISPPSELSRDAEAGIVIGSIALVSLILGAAMFYYYKRKPSANNIFTSRNKNLVPQRAISRPFPLDLSSARLGSSGTPRSPRAAPVVAMTERPLPPLPVRQSLMGGRSSSSYSRLP